MGHTPPTSSAAFGESDYHPRAALLLIAALVAFLGMSTGVAFASWAATDSSSANPARAVGDSLPQGATPGTPTTDAPNGTTVTVTFAQVSTTLNSAAITGYRLSRYPAGGGAAVPVTASCTIAAGAVSCVEPSVPDGNWMYTDTPTFAINWAGSESLKSGTVTVDTTGPVIGIDFPVNNDSYSNTRWGGASGAFSGTATDPLSGVPDASAIRLTITRSSDGTTWNGNAFAAGSNSVTASTYDPVTGSWTYDFPAADFPSDGDYYVAALATDSAGNTSAWTSTTSFTINNVVDVAIAFPAQGSLYNAASWTSGMPIAGTATAGSSVSVSIQKGSDPNGCWTGTGSAFTAACPNYLPVALSGSDWSDAFAAPNFGGDDAYTIKAKADFWGNSALATSTFVYDATPPAPTITSPAAGSYINTAPTISGTAGIQTADGTHSADNPTVTVKIYAGSGTGGALLETLTATVAGDGSWSVTGSALPAGQYTAQATQSDGAGNSAASSANTFTVALGPAVAIAFPPNGTFYNSTGWNSAHGSCPATNACGSATASMGTVTSVAVQIKDANTGFCWNGQSGSTAGFTSACTTNTGVAGGFFTATNTGINFSTWRIAVSSPQRLADGHSYLITASGTDGAGTQSTTTIFGYDNTPPAISNVHVVNENGGLDEVQPGHSFYVIATVADGFSGVGQASADISALDGVTGDTAVPLTACGSCSIRGTSYNYISGTFVAVNSTGNKNINLSAEDLASAPNIATTGNVTIVVENTSPTVKSMAINNKAGGIAGQPEPGDTIVVNYSSTLSVPSVCSTWSMPDTSPGTVSSNATVTITKGTADSVSVSSTDCSLHFGSINLGATGYVNGSPGQVLTFGGSTIAWDGNSKITITLGSIIGGTATQGTYAKNSNATYTPDASISDIAGNLISGTGTTGPKSLF